MKPSQIILIIGAFLLLGSLVNVGFQRSKISDLRKRIESAAPDVVPPVTLPDTSWKSPLEALSPEEKVELLRLRGEVGKLRQLLNVSPGPKASPGQSNAASRTVMISAPDGYRAASAWQNAGYATPENSLETFLWSIRNRDTNALLQSVAPRMVEELERMGIDKLFEQGGQAPGFRVAHSHVVSETNMVLEIQIDPRSEGGTEKMAFEFLDGGWKLAFN